MSESTHYSDLTPPLNRKGKARSPVSKRHLLPKHEASRNLFAEPELFEAWTVISKFHSDAFKMAGEREGVSRNDMMIHYLREDALAYWDDKGGFPRTKAEWDEKVAKFAERVADMKRQASEKRAGSAKEPAIADISEAPKK